MAGCCNKKCARLGAQASRLHHAPKVHDAYVESVVSSSINGGPAISSGRIYWETALCTFGALQARRLRSQPCPLYLQRQDCGVKLPSLHWAKVLPLLKHALRAAMTLRAERQYKSTSCTTAENFEPLPPNPILRDLVVQRIPMHPEHSGRRAHIKPTRLQHLHNVLALDFRQGQ